MPYPASDYLDLSHAPEIAVFPGGQPVWEALKTIGNALDALDWASLACSAGEDGISAGAFIGDRVHIGAGSKVEAGATIHGPAWIGKNCTVRSGAYLRENVIAGNGVMMGNSSEFKNCIVFDEAQAPHFNYVGDSVLGYHAHLGAGAILSNVRLDGANVRVPGSPDGGARIDTGLRKFGAIVGDHTEIGCNSVVSPGSILGKNCILYPLTHWRGVLPSETIVNLVQEQDLRPRRGK